MTRAVRIAWLTVMWIALWSEVSVANVLSGVFVAGFIVLAFDTWRTGRVVVRPWRALKFGAYFAWQLTIATFVVARTVVTPRDRIETGIVAVPLGGCSDALTTLIADAISLTPGTLTVEVRSSPLTLYVHALDVRDEERMRREIRRLEVLAVEAFGTVGDRAGLPTEGIRTWRNR